MSQNSPIPLSQTLQNQFTIIASFLGIFWIVEILDVFVFRGQLDRFGILPHSVIGLRGILFAPFLHGGFGHLIANSIPFAILAWLVMLQETSDFWIVTIVTMVVGGSRGVDIFPHWHFDRGSKHFNFWLPRISALSGLFPKKYCFHYPFHRCTVYLRQCPVGSIPRPPRGFLAGAPIWFCGRGDRRLVNCQGKTLLPQKLSHCPQEKPYSQGGLFCIRLALGDGGDVNGRV